MEYALYFARIHGRYAVCVCRTDSEPEVQIPSLLASGQTDWIIWCAAKDQTEIDAAKVMLEIWHKASHPLAPILHDHTAVQIDVP